jgi:hypothetical protein
MMLTVPGGVLHGLGAPESSENFDDDTLGKVCNSLFLVSLRTIVNTYEDTTSGSGSIHNV